MPGAPPGTPVGMMTDPELEHEVRCGARDAEAAAEMRARRESRARIRGIDPQERLAAHHGGGNPGTLTVF